MTYNRQLALMGGPNGESKGYPFRERGFKGLCQLRTEDDDFGEEFTTFCASIRRIQRRLTRWENHDGLELGVIAPVKRPRQNPINRGDDDDIDLEGSPSKEPIDPAETEDETEVILRRRVQNRRPPRPKANGKAASAKADKRLDETVADVDANGDTHMENGNDLDDVDKELLGMAEENDVQNHGTHEDEHEDDEDLDDADRALLGLDTGLIDDETDYSD